MNRFTPDFSRLKIEHKLPFNYIRFRLDILELIQISDTQSYKHGVAQFAAVNCACRSEQISLGVNRFISRFCHKTPKCSKMN